MDWHHQLLASLIWLAETFALCSIGMALGVALLARHTAWGRQIAGLTAAYFAPSRSLKPLAGLALITLLTLFAVRMNVLFSFWYNGFYTAMQRLDAHAFWSMLLVFAVLATVHVARAMLVYYVQQAFQVRWRTWLTTSLIERWLAHQAYYHSRFVAPHADNPDQRIAQDVDSLVSGTLGLSMGLLDAVVSLFAFSAILWGLSGPLTVLGHQLPRAMVFLVYAYALAATVCALTIGRPLVRLDFLNEQYSAHFRYALMRLHEYGESIAFYRGELVERSKLAARFDEIVRNLWAIIGRSLKFQGFNLTVSQIAVVFPFIVQAPRLLSRQITLGDVMQTAQAFGQVEGALSFVRTSYDEFAAYRAAVQRLAGFIDAVDATRQLPSPVIASAEQQLAVQSMTVNTPAGQPLVQALSITLAPGDALLIRGRSGAGKTSLLRALAGLWPYADGDVRRPPGPDTLFLPQQPYLPLGTLRAACHYPAPVTADAEQMERAAAALRLCQLPHLVARLDEEQDWTRQLSLGEQQRLAFARVLLNRPQLVFLDEASSALDEELEYAMYQLLRRTLPDAVIVSVGHRSTLLDLHTQELELCGDGRWRRRALNAADRPRQITNNSA